MATALVNLSIALKKNEVLLVTNWQNTEQEPRKSSGLLLMTALLLSTLSQAVGCGDGRPKRVQVTGRVTIDGEPLTHGYVRLFPSKGRMSGGTLDEEGRFRLSCFESGDGVILGEHKIAVLGQEQLDETRIRWHAPKVYARPTTSGLKQTIDSSTETIEIELTWGKEKGPFIEAG